MKRPGDRRPCFDAGTTDVEARELATVKLKVPKKRIEILRTGGGVLARARQENTE